MTLSIQTDRSLIRAAARSTRYVLVSFDAPAAERRTTRAPINVSLVLDRSGSMSGDKLMLAKQATENALRLLGPADRFSLVVYDDTVQVVSPSTLATPAAIRQALDTLMQIEPAGSTDLCGGWMRGCEQIALHQTQEGTNRCLLLTDGLANRGTTAHDELVRIAGDLASRDVQTTTFGVGADFDERLLRDMAEAGQGHFYFIATAQQIPDLLASEVGEALDVVARRAILRVALPPGASAECLNRFRQVHARGDNELHVQLGDLVSAQQVELVIRLVMPTGHAGQSVDVGFWVADADGALGTTAHEIRWTFAGHAENDRQARNRIVDRAVAGLYAARARADATEHNRHGDFARARHVLTATARRVRSYAGDDAELNRLADELLRDVETYAERVMGAAQLKGAFYAAEAAMKYRDPTGKARRSPPA
ncbi:MAG: vWA domain-containing protein [Gemmatimonadaceae bacterium]